MVRPEEGGRDRRVDRISYIVASRFFDCDFVGYRITFSTNRTSGFFSLDFVIQFFIELVCSIVFGFRLGIIIAHLDSLEFIDILDFIAIVGFLLWTVGRRGAVLHCLSRSSGF